MGVVKLALILGNQAADPLLHLTAVNPYVASAGGLCSGICAAPCSQYRAGVWLLDEATDASTDCL